MLAPPPPHGLPGGAGSAPASGPPRAPGSSPPLLAITLSVPGSCPPVPGVAPGNCIPVRSHPPQQCPPLLSSHYPAMPLVPINPPQQHRCYPPRAPQYTQFLSLIPTTFPQYLPIPPDPHLLQQFPTQYLPPTRAQHFAPPNSVCPPPMTAVPHHGDKVHCWP